MKKLRASIRHFLTVIFFLHFLIVFIYLLSGLFQIKSAQKGIGRYINPFFEQNWSLFSFPGESNKFVLFQYRLVNKKSGNSYNTEWLDISKPLLSFNNHYYFSISQRLIKYMSGCINNVYDVANLSINAIGKNQKLKSNDSLASEFVFNSLENKSSGYLSLKEYASVVYEKLALPEKQQYDSVTFSIKIIDDAFPGYTKRNEDFFNEKNHNYTEFNIEYGPLFK